MEADISSQAVGLASSADFSILSFPYRGPGGMPNSLALRKTSTSSAPSSHSSPRVLFRGVGRAGEARAGGDLEEEEEEDS